METKVVELQVNLGKSEEELNKLTKGFKKADEAATKLDATFEEIYGDLQPLTSRMGEAEDRLYELALAGQQASQEYRDLLTSVANYRQTQIQTDQVVDAAATTLGQKLGGAAQIAATGVQGVTAGMALFGAESVDTEKALLQVQSAMAFADAIAGVSSLRGQFTILKLAIEGSSAATKVNSAATAGAAIVQKLFTGGVATTTLGFKLLRGAIIATGIGALVVGVGLLIANFDKVKEVVFKLVPGLENVGKSIMNIVNSVTDFIGVTSEAGRAIDKQKALAEKSLKQNERYLKLNEHVLSESRKKEIALANEHFQRLIDGEFTKEQSLKIVREKAEIERRKKADELNKIIAQKNKEDNAKLIAQQKENELALKTFQNDVLANQAKMTIDRINQKAQEDLEEKDAQLKSLEDTSAMVDAIDAKSTADAKAESDKRIEIAKAEAQQKRDIQNAQLGLADGAVGFLKEIAGKNKAIQKAAIIAENAIGIGKMIIANNAANIGALATPQAILTSGASAAPVIAMNNITTGLGVATTLASTAKALSALGGGSAGSAPRAGGGGSSAPAAPNFNVVGTSGQNQIAQTLNREQPPVKAYVVANDVSTQQSLDRNIVKSASVG